MPEVTPGIYLILVFDADRPRMGWVNLCDPVRAVPEMHLRMLMSEKWYNGSIFAYFFGTLFYGTADLSNCGKLMGLSSWGTPRFRQARWLAELASRHFDPTLTSVSKVWGEEVWEGYETVDADALRSQVAERLGVDPRQHDRSEVLDLAASAQELFTDKLIEQVVAGAKDVLEEVHEAGLPSPTGVLYGGGCALSVITNARLREAIGLPFIIPPCAHDSSQFLGASILASLHASSGPLPLGRGWDGIPSHTIGDVRAEQIAQAGLPGRSAVPEEIAKRILAGEIIALIDGVSEAGPRALGRRSILANALDPKMRERINSTVKMREWYRPLAPALPADAFPHYFGQPATSPSFYMLDAFSLAPGYRSLLSTVSSPNGVTRPQAVHAHLSPWYHELLMAIGSLVGHPVVLNTSLNGPGLPIACDLSQALMDCQSLGVDAAVVSGILLEREAIAAGAQKVADRAP
jgi:carbamoyltransferase